VFAFYGRNRILLASLIVLFLCEISAVVAMIAIAVPKKIMVPSPLPQQISTIACLVVDEDSLLFNYWYI